MSRVAPLLLFSVLGIAASLSMNTQAQAATLPHAGNSAQFMGGGGVIIVQNAQVTHGGVIIVQN